MIATEGNPVKEAALQHAAMGYPVFPCRENDKKPATENGLLDATTDPEQIARWFDGPGAKQNLAIRTDGLCVVDVDGQENPFVLMLATPPLRPILQAPLQHTPHGGKHFVCRQNGQVLRNTQSKIAPKVDTRADGGYILVQPSEIDGKRYHWERPLRPVAELPVVPSCIAEKQAARKSKPASGPTRVELIERCWRYVQKKPDAISGQGGHDATFTAACECFRFGLTDSEAGEVLRRFNGTKTGGEQWTEKELDHKLQDARDEVTAAGEFGSKGQQQPRKTRSNGTKNRITAKSKSMPPAENGIEPICTPKGTTEAMNARRFAVRFGPDARYVEPWNKWLTWDGKRWRIDDCRAVDAMAKEIGRELWKEHEELTADMDSEEDNSAIKQMAAFCRASNSDHGLRALLAIARSEPGIPVLPLSLDQDPWLFNVENGTIDLRTGKLRQHDRADRITKLAPVEFQDGADCKTWSEFLEAILPDMELRSFMRRLVGYCLTGSTQEHVLPFLHGGGSNGKSTLLGVVLALLGTDYAIKAPTDLLLAKKNEAHPTELADLFGKRFVACIEAEDGRRLAESLVKELTGGDRIRARRMREDFWEFSATHKIWLGANHKPQVRGTDHGIWRRIKLIPFTVTIPDDKQDKELPVKLLGELPGILNWALQGCQEWQRFGLGEPSAVKEATNEYRTEMDVLGDFIAERCIEQDGLIEFASELYHAYAAWITERGERPVSQTRFGTQLETRGFSKDRDTSSGKITRLGIRLRKTTTVMDMPKDIAREPGGEHGF